MDARLCNDLDFRTIRKIHCTGSDALMTGFGLNDLGSGMYDFFNADISDLRVAASDSGNIIKVGENVKLKDVGVVFRGTGNTLIIKDDCEIENSYFVMKGDSNTIVLGNGCKCIGSFWGDFIINVKCGHTISLGSGCIASGDVVIRNSDGHDILDREGKKVNYETNIRIGNHVWIGYKCTLLKGVHIGDNCIIGSNSVVTGCVDDDSIVAGDPARLVKKLDGTWVR